MLTTLIIFVLILGLLVFVHEFGHFWVAKRIGVKVHEFAFGFRPRLYSWKRGETEYAINLLPFGGYVRLEGEVEDTGKKGSFAAKPPKARAAVLVAGVTMNLVLAWALLIITYMVGSYPLTATFDKHPGVISQNVVVITDIRENSPAALAGFRSGDIIQYVSDQSVNSGDSLVTLIKERAGQETLFRVIRDGQAKSISAIPRDNPPEGEGALGISTGEASSVRAKWYIAPGVALLELGDQISGAFVGFVGFVSNLIVNRQVSEDVSGIVGIGAATGIVRRLGIGPLLQFTALISTNLAVINILPILPLDGGHLLFLGLESIRKKPVKDHHRNWVAITGLSMILALFLIVTYRDFIRFAVIERIVDLF